MPPRFVRSLVRVSGTDARSFLQNLITQDLDGLDSAGALYGALLSPQGKVVSDMILWPEPGGAVLIDVDPERADSLLRRLELYKLRAQVRIESADDVAVVNDRFSGVADPRFPDGRLGYRKIVPTQEAGKPKNDPAYQGHRLNIGVPDLARDAGPEEVFAGEALLEELNGVAFNKGCFVGQENVSRMKRRATTRKKFCPVVFDGPAPAYGTPVRADATELGTIRTGQHGRAMALLRLDRAFEALDQGKALQAGDTPIKLAPPAWLILPARDDAPGAPD